MQKILCYQPIGTVTLSSEVLIPSMVTMVTMNEEDKNILGEENTNFTDQGDEDILDQEFLVKTYGGSFQGYIYIFFTFDKRFTKSERNNFQKKR